MTNQHSGTGTQATEIDRHENMPAIDRLIVANGILGAHNQHLLLAHEAINQAPVIQRLIPDEAYTPGRFWLGECAVCRSHDNEGFLLAYENGTATCAHPLCHTCADYILRTTRTCPKCRRLAHSFLLVRIP